MKKFIALLLSVALILSFAPYVNAASLSTEKTEVLSKRTVYSKTYRLSDGSYQFISRAEPIHYKDNSGAYVEINNAITDTVKQAGYKYTNTANQWNAHFSEKLDNSDAVMLTSGKYSISFSLTEQTGTAGVVKATVLASSKDNLSAYHQKLSADNRAVLYPDVAENVDIAYTVQADALKEDIILNSPLAPSVYKFRLTTNGLTIKETDGKLSLYTAADEEVFSFAPLYMEDANGKRSENVTMTYTSVKNGYELNVSADEEFLNAKDTAYPVVIDPTVTITGSSNTYDTCVDQQYPSTNYYLAESLWTGGKVGTNAMRTYIKFDLPTDIYVSSQVTSAFVFVMKRDYETPHIKAYPVTSSWSSSAVTWNNKPNFNSEIYTPEVFNTEANRYRLNVKNILQCWLFGSIPNHGLVLKEPNETDSAQKTRFYSSEASSPNKPELVIEYKPYYGSRSYQATSLTTVNCMGYALEYKDFLSPEAIGVDQSQMYGKTLNQAILEFKRILENWLNKEEHIGADNWAYIDTYNSRINEGWFRVYCRVGFDNDDFDYTINDDGEELGFHWLYQTKTGDWAYKNGSAPSAYFGNSGNYNPAELIKNVNDDNSYAYVDLFFQIRDIRSESWS